MLGRILPVLQVLPEVRQMFGEGPPAFLGVAFGLGVNFAIPSPHRFVFKPGRVSFGRLPGQLSCC